jgi:hypothetical protein
VRVAPKVMVVPSATASIDPVLPDLISRPLPVVGIVAYPKPGKLSRPRAAWSGRRIDLGDHRLQLWMALS